MSKHQLRLFECLICHRFLKDLWKAEQHVKYHEKDGGVFPNGHNQSEWQGPRRRGMLPFQNVTFPACSVPIVRNQVDPKFLEQNSYTVEAKGDNICGSPAPTEDVEDGPPILDYYGTPSSPENVEDSLLSLLLPSLLEEEDSRTPPAPVNNFETEFSTSRKVRQSRLKATAKLQEIALIMSDEEEGSEASKPKKKKRAPHIPVPDELRKRKPGPILLKCDQCPREFTCTTSWKLHIRAHQQRREKDANKPFQCPACPLRFCRADSFRRHFTLHLQNNPFSCDATDCGAKFNSEYNLRRHKLMMHEGGGEWHQIGCPICLKKMTRKDTVRRHLRTVHGTNEAETAAAKTTLAKPTCVKTSLPRRYKRRDVTSKFPFGTIPVSSDEPEMKPKVEDLCYTEEEIHLVDKMMIEEGGKVRHLKGETLTPVVQAKSVEVASRKGGLHTSWFC